jgi:hypothetical protein
LDYIKFCNHEQIVIAIVVVMFQSYLTNMILGRVDIDVKVDVKEPTPSAAPNSALVIGGATVAKTSITIIHHGGDTVVDAFAFGGSWWNDDTISVIYLPTGDIMQRVWVA